MDKNAIKKYAVWARTELIDRVRQRAALYDITAEADPNADSVNGKILSAVEKNQRQAAVKRMQEKGYGHVIEEAAYTWFNRLAALRYMEVNNVLPSRVRVFTDENGEFKPQILSEAIHLNLDGLDMENVYTLKEEEATEELYKYLIITQCNALSSVLPGMFQKIDDYTEILFPDNLLREGSVAERMVSDIQEDDWKDAVQIIGWLYQYYNTEPKKKVFADLKKNIKITKETIPAATQLFTPDWIVRYMVENSLGRLWVEGHPNEELKSGWKYYLDEAEQEPEVKAQLTEIRKEYAALTPEDIKTLDPCCGSGHLLAYMFDVLMEIYNDFGYSARESVASILGNNIYGLDIDERAAQLAYFSVMMKAVQYDTRFLKRREIPQPHVYAIHESNHINNNIVDYFCNQDPKLIKAMGTLIFEMHDASEYGSIITVSHVDFDALNSRFNEIKDDISLFKEQVLNELLPLVETAETLARKYDVVVTNPPYMVLSGGNNKLNRYVKNNFPESKYDLFSVFIEQCSKLVDTNRYFSMITQQAWMFQPTFNKLRAKLSNMTIINLLHLGARAFDDINGEVVQTVSFVICKRRLINYLSTYKQLTGENSEKSKKLAFYSSNNNFYAKTKNFEKLPNRSISYWISPNMTKAFNNERIGDYAISDGQTKTGDNEKYLRFLWEVNNASIGKDNKWALIAKGGQYKKWAGNIEMVIDWSKPAREHYRSDHVARIAPEYIWFRKGVCWNHIASSNFAARILDSNTLFETAAPSIFFKSESLLWQVLAFLNTQVSNQLLKIINPTLSTNVGDITIQPILSDKIYREKIENIAKDCVAVASQDWNSFETSWDFKVNALVSNENLPIVKQFGSKKSRNLVNLDDRYKLWKEKCNNQFITLQTNEVELNRIFLNIYELQSELSPEVEDKDVTVHYIADTKEDAPEGLQKSSYLLTKQDVIKSLISYAVGCIFGRYSLDEEGLIYAGGDWDPSRYQKFPADQDNILPICDEEYFEDDIVGLFIKFIETVYGEETLEENLSFIADALGGKGTPREVIRKYFLNDFFKDHCKTYKKRPIYWLFDSGKKNGFKALVYMHRYQPDTIARMRTDYVHEQQSRYRTAITDLENRLNDTSTSERVRLNKQLVKIKAQSDEIRIYEEKIHHIADQMIEIELDDGVKYNYALFQDVLAKIK